MEAIDHLGLILHTCLEKMMKLIKDIKKNDWIRFLGKDSLSWIQNLGPEYNTTFVADFYSKSFPTDVKNYQL